MAKRSKKRLSAKVQSHRFERRWLELTGVRFRASGRIPAALVNSLSSMRIVRLPLPRAPELVVFARKHEGKDCEEKVEIAGWYSRQHNGKCVGAAAVLKILNNAASQLCSQTLHCPSRCPCTYVPRKRLGSYRCTATLEEGFLMQGVEEWNCFCFSQ